MNYGKSEIEREKKKSLYLSLSYSFNLIIAAHMVTFPCVTSTLTVSTHNNFFAHPPYKHHACLSNTRNTDPDLARRKKTLRNVIRRTE